MIGRETLHATSLRPVSCQHKTAMKERRRCEGPQPWVKPTEQVKNPRNGETHGVHIPSPLEPQSGSKRSTQHISHPQRLGPIIIAPDDKNSTTGKKIARGCYWPPLRGSIGRGQFTGDLHPFRGFHPFRGLHPRLCSFAPTELTPHVLPAQNSWEERRRCGWIIAGGEVH